MSPRGKNKLIGTIAALALVALLPLGLLGASAIAEHSQLENPIAQVSATVAPDMLVSKDGQVEGESQNNDDEADEKDDESENHNQKERQQVNIPTTFVGGSGKSGSSGTGGNKGRSDPSAKEIGPTITVKHNGTELVAGEDTANTISAGDLQLEVQAFDGNTHAKLNLVNSISITDDDGKGVEFNWNYGTDTLSFTTEKGKTYTVQVTANNSTGKHTQVTKTYRITDATEGKPVITLLYGGSEVEKGSTTTVDSTTVAVNITAADSLLGKPVQDVTAIVVAKGENDRQLKIGATGDTSFKVKESKSYTVKVTAKNGEGQDESEYRFVFGDDKPPIIEARYNQKVIEDGFSAETQNKKITLQLKLTDGNTGNGIARGNLKVSWTKIDSGETLTASIHENGKGSYTVDLPFGGKKGNLDDYEAIVTATNASKSNKQTSETYHFSYDRPSARQKIGECTVMLDLSTVKDNDPIIASIPVDLHAEVSFGEDFEAGMKAAGYEVTSQDKQGSYYVSSISLPTNGLEPNKVLWNQIEDFGIGRTNIYPSGDLGERHFTSTSGWVIFINGVSVGSFLGNEPINPGDVVTFCFTLADGFDVGAGGAGTDSFHFCGRWYNGTNIFHDISVYVEDEAPTCTKPGSGHYECSVEHRYGWSSVQRNDAWGSVAGATEGNCEYFVIDPLGHDYQLDPKGSWEAEPGIEGNEHWVCSRCGDAYDVEIPALPEEGE